MKDVFSVKRSADSDDVLKSLNGSYKRVLEIADATYTVDDADSGCIYTLTKTDGIAITLPAAEAGLNFKFHIGATSTGTITITADSSSDTYQGEVRHHDKDHLGTVVALNENIDTDGWNFPAAADYVLTLDADTDGRFIGGLLEFTAISDSKWLIEGFLFGDGTATHIFS
jgi:hypothetical protein